MTSRDDEFLRRVSAWLDADAPDAEPTGLLESILTRTERTRRRPGWITRDRWVPGFVLPRLAVDVPRYAWLLVILPLLVALVVVALEAGSERRLPPAFGPARNGLIAMDTAGDIVVTRADGGGRRNLTRSAALETSPSFSPDGTKIAFWFRLAVGMPTSLWVMSADGSDRRKVSGDADLSGSEGTQVAWSPDSGEIAFSVGDYYSSARLYVVSIDGRRLQEVGTGSLARADPAWSPDGRLIAFRGHTNGVLPDVLPPDDAIGVYVIAPDGSGERLVSRSARAGGAPNCGGFGGPNAGSPPSWSPDGRSLAYATGQTDHHRLVVADVDGSAERIVSDAAEADDLMPAFSPDGERIAFQRLIHVTDGQSADLVVTDAGGSDARTLNVGTGLSLQPVSWSPDGRFIVSYSRDLATIRVLAVEGAVGSSTSIDAPDFVESNSSSCPTEIFQRASWQRLAP